MKDFKYEDKIEVGDTVYVKEKGRLTGEPFDSWLGKPQIVTNITWDNFDECYFIKVRGNDDWWRKIWWEVKDSSKTQAKTQENNKGNEMKKVMKEIETKIALEKDINKSEYTLITIAGEALYRKARKNNVFERSWDIKAQDALENLFDANGDISSYYYFQLKSCDFDKVDQYDWVGEEIEKLTLAAVENDDSEDKILFESCNLKITVNIQLRKLALIKSIRRGPNRDIVDVKIYFYKYDLDRLNSLGDQLVK